MSSIGTAAGSRKKDRRRKPDELLSSVVSETATPAAVELLRANERFTFPSGNAWVMLHLKASGLGGLSKKHGRDEAKGSIIQLINADEIHVVATEAMLEVEEFGIIPDVQSLGRMEEYSLFVNAPYQWSVVWQRPNGDLVIDPVTETTFAQVQQVSRGEISLRAAVTDTVWANHSGEAVSAGAPDNTDDTATDDTGNPDNTDNTDDTATNPRTQVLDQVGSAAAEAPVGRRVAADDEATRYASSGEDNPSFDDEPAGADEPVFDPGPEFQGAPQSGPAAEAEAEAVTEPAPQVEPAPEADSAGSAGPAWDDDAVDGGYNDVDDSADAVGSPAAESTESTENAATTYEPLADQAAVYDTIVRRFMNDGLELVVDFEEFDRIYAAGLPVDFPVSPPPMGASAWLGDQVAHLNHQASMDLADMRRTHLKELRQGYALLTAKHIEGVIRAVSISAGDSKYSEMSKQFEEKRDLMLSGKDEEIRQAKKEIAEAYDKEAERRAQAAAEQARTQYMERHRGERDRKQAEVATEVDRRIEDAHQANLLQLLDIRSEDAGLKMEAGKTAIYEALNNMRDKQDAAERALMDTWQANIKTLIEEHRQSDITQVEALREHQRVTDELGELRRAQAAELESREAGHADRIRRMEEALDRAKADAVTQMGVRDEEWRHALQLEQERNTVANTRITELLTQRDEIERNLERRYRDHLDDAERQKRSLVDGLSQASAMQSRSNRILVVLMVALCLLGVIGGFIFGVGYAS